MWFRHHSQTLRLDHSVCWRQDQRWKFSRRKKMRIQFPCFFRSFNNRVFLSRRSWTIAALNREQGFPGRSQTLSSHFFLPFWTQWRLKFFFSVPVLSFSGMSRIRMPFISFWMAAKRLAKKDDLALKAQGLVSAWDRWWTLNVLMASLPVTWDLRDQGRTFRDFEAFNVLTSYEKSFCRRSAALKSQFLKPARNKMNISICLAAITRYLTLSNFYKYN